MGGGLAKALQSDPDLKGVQASTKGDDVVITGNVPSLEAHGRAAELAKTYGGKHDVEDLTSVTGNQMVAVEIKFAAVSVSTLNELGFNFQKLGGNLQGATTAPSTVNTASVSSGGLNLGTSPPLQSAFNLFLNSSKAGSFATLSVLSGTGLVQLLAEPTLLVRSGEHASFLAGGEVPIPVAAGRAQPPERLRSNIISMACGWKSNRSCCPIAGSRSRSRPRSARSNNSNNLSFDGFSVPAFLRRSTSTMVELGDGQSFVLAGLMYNNNSFTENKVPWLGDIPILGDFFKATKNSRERQELVIIATPHLVHPMDPKAIPPLPGQTAAQLQPDFRRYDHERKTPSITPWSITA